MKMTTWIHLIWYGTFVKLLLIIYSILYLLVLWTNLGIIGY
jgi:hypothetical protein